MLQATVKLCCGIAHDPLRRLPGLTAAATQDARGMLLLGAQQRPAKAPRCFHQLAGKDADACEEVNSAPSSGQLTSTATSAGEQALRSALGILQQQHGWHVESTQAAGAAVASMTLPGLGRVFCTKAVLSAPLARVHQELFEEIERMPEWYPALSFIKVLRCAGPDTLLTHEVTARTTGDLVGPRDFVSVRHRHRTSGAIYLVGTAASASERPPPPAPGCIRAEVRLSCMVLQPLAGEPGQTHLTWLLCMDLKGWIPAAILQRVLPQSQADFISHLQQRLASPTQP